MTRNLLILLAAVFMTSCGSCNRPPRPEPTPTPPPAPPAEEQCATAGLTCGCWDMPPGSGWQWVCCDPYEHVPDPNSCGGGAPCPGPTPVPTPTPPPAECRTTRVDSFRNILKPHSGQQVDFTVVACGGDVVATNNNCLANCCELSAEKGNQACADRLFGMPKWYPRGIGLLQVNEGNTYTQKVVAGVTAEGTARVCGHSENTEGNCVIAPLAAVAPPCNPPGGSNQGCARNVPVGGFNR